MNKIPWGNNENLDNDQFFNRSIELNHLKQMLLTTKDETPPNILLTGIRGVGKTVFLKKIKRELEDDGFLVIYINFSQAECFRRKKMSINALMQFYFKKTLSSCNNNILENASEKLKKYLKTNNFHFKEFQEVNKIPIPIFNSEIDNQELMEYVLTFPEKIYKSNKDKLKGIIILIDEFQIIKELNDYKESFLWVIRSYIQDQRNIAYVFTGSMSLNDALISEISGHNGVFGGRMISFHLSPFSKNTVKQYLNEKKPGLKFSEDGFNSFYEYTFGIPAYINNFAKILSENIEFTSESITREFNESIYYISSNLVNIWFELSYKNKIIIISLLNGPIRRIDIAKYLNVKSGSLSSNLKELENLSLIQKSEDNLYSISEPLLKKWLKSEFNEKGEYPFLGSRRHFALS